MGARWEEVRMTICNGALRKVELEGGLDDRIRDGLGDCVACRKSIAVSRTLESGRGSTITIFWIVDAEILRHSPMVKEVFTYVWCFHEEWNIMFLKFVGGANAGEHEELWGPKCAATDYYFSIGFEDLTRGQFDARSLFRGPTVVLEYDFFDGRIGQDFDVFKSIRFACGLALAIVPNLDMGCHAFVVSAIVIRYSLYANL